MMKKFILYSFFLALGMMAMVSCSGDKDNDGPNGSSTNNKYDPKTMTEEEYLEDTGKKFVNLFKAADQKPLIQLLNYMADTYENYEFSEFDDDGMYMAARHLSSALSHKPANISRAVYSYVISLSQISGVWEPNDRREEWVKTANSDAFILRFPYRGDKVEIKLAGSGSEWVFNYVEEDYYDDGDYYDEETEDYTIKVPSTLKLTLTAGSNKYVDAVAKTNYTEGKSCNATIDATLMNIKVSGKMNATNTAVTENSTLYVSDIKALSTTAVINGRNMLDPETWATDDETALEALKNGSADINILGNVTVKSEIYSFETFAYNIDGYYETKQEAKRAAKKLNENVTAEMFFNGKKEAIGSLAWETTEFTYEDYYYDYSYWTVTPYLNIESTGAAVSFEKFFSEKDFGDLYDLVESIISSYKRLWK